MCMTGSFTLRLYIFTETEGKCEDGKTDIMSTKSGSKLAAEDKTELEALRHQVMKRLESINEER